MLSPSAGQSTVPFHGAHQAGVATPPQAHLSLLGLDLLPEVDGPALARLLRVLSDDIARLTAGQRALADTEPELATVPARLTVTVGIGPRVATTLIPTARRLDLTALPHFATDRLLPRWGQSDLVVQICADDAVTVAHARRMLLKDSRAFSRTRWVQDGFRRAHGSVPGTETMRNLMGQVDGTVNPTEADPAFAGLVWAEADDHGAAFAGGTFMAVRRVRMDLDTWDRVDRPGREFAVGRRLADGAPLTGGAEFDEPDFDATDDVGFPVIDPAAHIRRARTDDPRQRFHRRGYNYTQPDPDRPTGEDSGLIFIAFARDLPTQFVPIQERLAQNDRLNQWISTIGSAVYAVLPGVRDDSEDYLGRALIAARD
ncbi:Dyp-type peroxidase [Nocardioides sp. R-C-SC26]|uniref:Dyp-type peroxidase n=1 Tax=Nocardioides sp. R-C-SC26 TaxID=2870414 RepID=UPI001E3F8CD2|nr:Dyp-type peroxidase [Nocardioides sp. R-C-SC26]